MTRAFLPLLTALCAALIVPPALAQSRSSKLSPGLWEHGFAIKTAGGEIEKAMKEMQQSLASLPPEQRRQMEAMMAQQGMSVGPKGNTVRVCVTKEEAERDQLPEAQEGCTQSATRNGNVWSIAFKCPGPPPSSGDGTVTLQSPTAYAGVMNFVTTNEGRTEKMQMTTSGKWLGTSCGSIKPAKP